jgi:hypothetical protein
VSLSPSPPFSVSWQAGRGLIKIFALSVQNTGYATVTTISACLHLKGKIKSKSNKKSLLVQQQACTSQLNMKKTSCFKNFISIVVDTCD